MGNESQKPKKSLNILLETTGEDLIDALYLAASKPNDNLSIGLLKVSNMSLSHCFLGRLLLFLI